MDLLLEVCDTYLLDYVYGKVFPVNMLPSSVTNSVGQFLDLNTGNLNGTAAKPAGDVYGYEPFLLEFTDYTFQSIFPRYNLFRETLTMFVLMTIFGWALYFSVATMSYLFVFDKAVFNHPRYLKNQMSLEMKQAFSAIPVMVLLTIPWFLFELNGYSKLALPRYRL